MLHRAAIVCHDAGATNLIVHWARTWNTPTRAFVQGPAETIWRRSSTLIPTCESLLEALDGTTFLISGTGWASDLEHEARILAKAKGIRSVAVIDHWVNYKQRFSRLGTTCLPDEIWVADAWAKQIAEEEFPSIPVQQIENLYLQDQVSKVDPPPNTGTLLYVLEPVRNEWNRGVEGEFQALDYLLVHLDALASSPIRRIVLRPHPSDPEGKYNCYLAADPRIELDRSADMAAAISQADMVAGVESFALTLALAAGRAVYSSLPPWAPALRLPQEGILQIRLLCPT